MPIRLVVVTIYTLAAVVAPCLYLAWNRGGTGVEVQAVAYAGVLLALAMRTPRRAGWGVGFLLVWPALQLVPSPPLLLRWLAPERAAEIVRFAGAGVTAAGTISLYPYATVQTLVMLAGTGALFLLARETRRRAGPWVLVAVVGAGLIEAAIALRQYLLVQTGLLAEMEMRGTFGNRNILAAWLVGCYGAALALWAGETGRRRWFVGAAAVVLGAATVLTFSRMGVIALVSATVVFGVTRRRAGLATGLAVAAVAALVGIPALAARYRPEVLALEKQGRVAMWADSLGALRRYAILGAGAGAFPYAFRRSHPYLEAYTIDHSHSDYLETLVEWGAPAGLLLAGTLVGSVVRRRSLDGREWGCLAGVAGILVHGLADFPLRVPAVAGLVAVLLGLAARDAERGPGRRVVATVAVALAVLSFALPRLNGWNAAAQYDTGRRAFEEGQVDAAEQAYRRGLAANPYAAPLWMELAFLAEARGDADAALRYAGLAADLEPHTNRTQWWAQNLYLRLRVK
jgi:tetratricopeptide (TPR) repeat protein